MGDCNVRIKPWLLAVASFCWMAHPVWAARGMEQDVAQAIERGLSFLASQQHASGTFSVDVCRDDTMRQCEVERTVAGAIIVGYALKNMTHPLARTIRDNTLQFLREEQEPSGLWRYLPHGHPAYTRFPPDLDDTSIAGLLLRDDPERFARAVQAVACRQDATGLYPTWATETDPHAPPDINNARYQTELQNYDCGVNANVLALLAADGKEAAPVCAHLKEVAAARLDSGCSVYYPTPPILAYAIARAYAEGAACLAPTVPALQAALLARRLPEGHWGSYLETALAVSALHRVGWRGAPASAQRYLLEGQTTDGSWPRELYYRGHGVALAYGSAAVTTAFALEALAWFEPTAQTRGKPR